MRGLVFFTCTFLYSMGCNATSCIDDEKATIERSSNYLKEIYIDVDKSDLSFYVSISLPSKLEALELASLTLVRGRDEAGDDFMMPLSVMPENKRMVAWYLIGRDLSGSNIIEAVYGDPCGSPIRYRVDYEKESLEPVTINLKITGRS